MSLPQKFQMILLYCLLASLPQISWVPPYIFFPLRIFEHWPKTSWARFLYFSIVVQPKIPRLHNKIYRLSIFVTKRSPHILVSRPEISRVGGVWGMNIPRVVITRLRYVGYWRGLSGSDGKTQQVVDRAWPKASRTVVTWVPSHVYRILRMQRVRHAPEDSLTFVSVEAYFGPTTELGVVCVQLGSPIRIRQMNHPYKNMTHLSRHDHLLVVALFVTKYIEQ